MKQEKDRNLALWVSLKDYQLTAEAAGYSMTDDEVFELYQDYKNHKCAEFLESLTRPSRENCH